MDPLPLNLRAARRTQDQPITIEYDRAWRAPTTHFEQDAEFNVVDDLAIADFKRAAVAEEADCGIGFRSFKQHGPVRGRCKQVAALTGSPLDDHMPIGGVHQVTLWVVAERLDERAVRVLLATNEAPGTKQRTAQV